MHWLKKCCAIIVLIVAAQGIAASEALARGAAFSFDSVWFYRDGTRVVPEISKRWITVVFNRGGESPLGGIEPPADNEDNFIQKKARAIVKANPAVTEYLYDPNLSDKACFLKLRKGIKLEEINRLISRLGDDGSVKYVHPALLLNNKTYAYFNVFDLEWKTGTPKSQREALLKATHVVADEGDQAGRRCMVDVKTIPFFRALNLLAEDVKVLRVTPHLVEIKPSIAAKLSLLMGGGNIGDAIPFTLTIAFSDRVTIDPSSISTLSLRPPEIQKELFDCTVDPYDYAKAATKSPIVITGKARFYAPGEYTIPPVKIGYSCPTCPNSTVRTIETEPVLFKVSSMIPTDKSENRLIVPTDPVRADFPMNSLNQSERYKWLVIGSFAGAVLCLLLLAVVVVKAGADRRRVKKRRNPAELAERLRTVLHEEAAVPHCWYLRNVGSLLREYLVVLSDTDDRYVGGSGKQFMETVGPRLPEEHVASIAAIVAAIDNSVAREAEEQPDIGQLQQEILKVVEGTARNGARRG